MSLSLELSRRVQPSRGPLVLVVMDGVGEAPATRPTPSRSPAPRRSTGCGPRPLPQHLRAHGTAVGLPTDDDMGNSEVGHNALGAGQVYDQGAKLVNRAIATGAIFEGAAWQRSSRTVQERGGALHFIGLLSDGNVHSHIDHLDALLARGQRDGVPAVCVHVLLDGRDVADDLGAGSTSIALEQFLAELGARRSRRSHRLRRRAHGHHHGPLRGGLGMVERGWNAHVLGEGARVRLGARGDRDLPRGRTRASSIRTCPPFVVAARRQARRRRSTTATRVVFFNFRGDRAIEISPRLRGRATSTQFDRGRRPDVLYAGMMEYDGDLPHPQALPRRRRPRSTAPMGEYLAAARACPSSPSRETQKFGHVTYFWNGNRSGKFDDRHETYLEIPSDHVPFDQRPWMKAAEITDALIDELRTGRSTSFARVNYANGDMVGHTGGSMPR